MTVRCNRTAGGSSTGGAPGRPGRSRRPAEWYRDTGGPQRQCPVYQSCNLADVLDDADQAHLGTRSASILNNSRLAANWLSFGRQVRIPAGSTQCNLSAWILADYIRNIPVRVNLEVIRAADWSYEVLTSYRLTNLEWMGTWHRYSSDLWYPGPRDVVIRVVLLGQDGNGVGIQVDDVVVSCKVG